MRILHVNDFHSGGGCEIHMHAAIALLRRAGHEARAFVGADAPRQARSAREYLTGCDHPARLTSVLSEFLPDAVHLHNFYHVLSPAILGALAAWKRERRGRVIMTAHDFHLICPNPGFNRAAGETIRRLEPETALPIPASSLLRTRWDARGRARSLLRAAQHLWHYRVGARQRVIDEIIAPSCLLTDLLRRAGLPARHLPIPMTTPVRGQEVRAGAEVMRLIFAGRIEPEKGIVRFIRMLPDDCPVALTVVGDGSLRGEVECLGKERPDLRLRCTGWLTPEEAAAEIARHHVLVLPSLCFENAPLSLLDALVAGTSILTSDFGGMAEIVRDTGVGETFDPDDASSLAEALTRLSAALAAGTLNSFEIGGWIAERSPDRWLSRVLALYAGDAEPALATATACAS